MQEKSHTGGARSMEIMRMLPNPLPSGHDAFAEGDRARLAGEARGASPHPAGSPEQAEWVRGWDESPGLGRDLEAAPARR